MLVIIFFLCGSSDVRVGGFVLNAVFTLFSGGLCGVWFWVNEVDFLRQWDRYGAQVGTIRVESRLSEGRVSTT